MVDIDNNEYNDKNQSENDENEDETPKLKDKCSKGHPFTVLY
jgi:hypothetical protein